MKESEAITRDRLRDEIHSRSLSGVREVLLVGAGLVVVDVGLHQWIAQQCALVDDNDAAFLGAAKIAVDVAIAVSLLGIGLLGWILERRRRQVLVTLQQMREQLRAQAERESETPSPVAAGDAGGGTGP